MGNTAAQQGDVLPVGHGRGGPEGFEARRARARSLSERGRVTTATPEQAQERSGERVGQRPKGRSVCGGYGLPVAFNSRQLRQSMRRAVSFGWQRAARAQERPEPDVAMPCNRTSILGSVSHTIHLKASAAVTDSASGDAPFARWTATMAMRKNQNVGEGVSARRCLGTASLTPKPRAFTGAFAWLPPGRATDDGDVRQQQGSKTCTTPNRKG